MGSKRKSHDEPAALPAPDSDMEINGASIEKKSKKDKSKLRDEKREKKNKKKEKKEKNDKKKDKKRKRSVVDEEDAKLEEEEEQELAIDMPPNGVNGSFKKDKKKNKSADSDDEDDNGADADRAANGLAADREEPPAKKTKMSKKAKWRAAKRAKTDGEENGEIASEASEAAPDEAGETEKKKKKPRFILFVGNLPYSATAEDIEKHFASVKPSRVRLLTEKDGAESKGCAFIEVSGSSRMEKCLLKMHKSMLTAHDGEKRKINVEVSAGGGGSNPTRMDKIRKKNAKLDVERARKAQAEDDAKHQKKKEKHKAKKNEEQNSSAGESSELQDEESKEEGQKEEEDPHAGIHPSRLAQMAAPHPDETEQNRQNGKKSRFNGGRRGGGKGGHGGKFSRERSGGRSFRGSGGRGRGR